MRITFLMTVLDISGGVRVVRDHAEYLAAQGHDVTIVEHSIPAAMTGSKARRILRNLARGQFGLARPTYPFSISIPVLRVNVDRAGWQHALPDADVVVASWWLSCEFASQLPPRKGRKVHLVQDHEVFAPLPVERCRASIGLIPTKIVVSGWLEQVMRDEYGCDDIHVVPNGIDVDLFAPRRKTMDVPSVVGTLYSPTERKNSGMAVHAFLLARERSPELKLVSFGADAAPEALRGQDWATYHQLPARNTIPDLYSSCRVWLFPSLSEGFGLPLLEALACGTPVIATRAGAAPDLIDGENGLLVDTDPESMAAAIGRICALPPATWTRFSQRARATALAHRLSDANAAFEAALLDITA